MRVGVTGPVIGFVLAFCAMLHADDVVPISAEERFAQLEQMPAPKFPTPAPVQTPITPFPLSPITAYPQTSPQTVAPSPSQYLPSAGSAPFNPPADLAQQQVQIIPPEMICRESPYRNDSWLIELELIPAISEFGESEFGGWTDDGTLAFRLNLGFEDEIGNGLRVRLWAFGDEFNTPAARVELGASTFNWDLYRRLYIEDTELVLGGGVIGAHLEFEFPQIDEHARFNGGGVTVLGEAFFPLAHYRKTDIGSIVRARLSVLRGEWRDSGTPFVPDSNHDSMTIADVAFGLELRRRFGLHEDKYWLLRFVPEYQRWDSAWLGEFADSNIAFVGTDISFGLAW